MGGATEVRGSHRPGALSPSPPAAELSLGCPVLPKAELHPESPLLSPLKAQNVLPQTKPTLVPGALCVGKTHPCHWPAFKCKHSSFHCTRAEHNNQQPQPWVTWRWQACFVLVCTWSATCYLSLISVDITKHPRLNHLQRKEIYLARGSGGWSVQWCWHLLGELHPGSSSINPRTLWSYLMATSHVASLDFKGSGECGTPATRNPGRDPESTSSTVKDADLYTPGEAVSL